MEGGIEELIFVFFLFQILTLPFSPFHPPFPQVFELENESDALIEQQLLFELSPIDPRDISDMRAELKVPGGGGINVEI